MNNEHLVIQLYLSNEHLVALPPMITHDKPMVNPRRPRNAQPMPIQRGRGDKMFVIDVDNFK